MTIRLFDEVPQESGVWFGSVASRSGGEVRSVCDVESRGT